MTRGLSFDRQAGEYIAVFAVVLGAAVALSYWLKSGNTPTGPPPALGGDSAGNRATIGIAWAVAEVAFAVFVLGLIYAMRRAPEWLSDVIGDTINVAIVFFAGGLFATWPGMTFRGFMLSLVGLSALVFVFEVADEIGLWWVINNALALALAAGFGVFLGAFFGAIGIAGALLVLVAYDHYFANENQYMFDIGKAMVDWQLPVMFIRPSTWRFDWERVVEMFDTAESDADLDDDTMAWGLGTADLMLPAALVSGAILSSDVVATFGVVAVIAIVAGVFVACGRLSYEIKTRGSGAGLPALAAGVLVPYVTLAVVAAVA